MQGLLYIYLKGANNYERVHCAVRHCEMHRDWIDLNIDEGKVSNFIHTDEYKIMQQKTDVIFEVGDIKIALVYHSTKEKFISAFI